MSNRRALSNAVKESKQPKQLSKPKDIDYNSQMGYRDNSPFRNKSSIDINTPNGTIDMSNTGIPLMANGRYLPPYSGTHKFDTNVVRETPFAEGGTKKRKKQLTQPGQWAGVTPELVQPGNETFDLPTTPTVPAEFETVKCPMFHRYDPNVEDCVPFTEEEKAAYGLQYMQDWTKSPMHEEMLRTSIEKDAPVGNVDDYVKNITDLRLRATDPNISFFPTGKDVPIGEADPYNLYESKYTNGEKLFNPSFNSKNEQDILNEKKLNTPLYLQSGVNNLNFYKTTHPDYTHYRNWDGDEGYKNIKTGEKVKSLPESKDLKSQAIFYTKDLPGEHAYVYPHEFSHLQDMGGGLIPASDYKTIESGVLPGTVSYNKIKEISKKYNIDSDISKNDPETYKKYLEEVSDVYKKEYPKYRKYDADKKLYETDYNKYKVQRNEGDIINSPSDNSIPYEEFIQKHLANKFFTDIDERKDYIGLDTEARARLNAIRMYGKASGIYDPYTEKLTPEKYNEIQNLFNDQNPNASDANQLRQLQEVYKDEDILNMLNTISKNDSQDRTNEIDQAKKGGGLKSKKYSRSLQATNKFFREHSFFEKPKKLSKKRIYDPNAKYYEMGGENDCPKGYIKDDNGNCVWHDPAQENSIIDKSAIHPVEYSRSQLTMGDPFYNTHTVALNDKNQATWQAKNEDQIKTNLRNTTLKNFIQRHPEESTGLELGYLHNNIWTTPTLGLEKVVEDPTDPGYAPNQLSFERNGKHPNVYFIKNPVEGSAEAPSRTYAKAFQDYVNKDLSKDNAYNKASNDIGKQLLKKGYKGENMWGKNDSDQLYQLYGTEGTTLKGATEITPETLKYLESIKDSEEGKRHLAKLAGISEDDPDYANMLMHYNTTPLDVYADSARPENNDLIRTEEEIPEEQTFLRNTEGPTNYQDGGSTDNYVEIDIPKDQIQKYVDGGYIVEDISVPELSGYAEGGEANYQLGDEIDEPTMKRLKKLGYTFEKI